jgi:molecular chaperone GrpE (heat shock protein)
MTPVKGLFRSLLGVAYARLRVLTLRRRVMRAKAQQYEELAENVRGLRRALQTGTRALEDAHAQIAAYEAQIARMRGEYSALEQRLEDARGGSAQDVHLELFGRLQAVVTQIPTVRAAVEDGAQISARDVLVLLAPLDDALRDLGFETIGVPGADVPYDPRLHRVVGAGEAAPGEPVQVRYVGYTHRGSVVCKAQVILSAKR